MASMDLISSNVLLMLKCLISLLIFCISFQIWLLQSMMFGSLRCPIYFQVKVDLHFGSNGSIHLMLALLTSGSNVYGQLGRANHEIGLFPVDKSFPHSATASGLGHPLAICQVKSAEGKGDVMPQVLLRGDGIRVPS